MNFNVPLCGLFFCLVINCWSSNMLLAHDLVGQQSCSSIDTMQPILIDKSTLSGLGLKQIELNDQPGREFFQKNVYRGADLSVYVVSSQSWPGRMDNFGIDEYIYMLNGKARVRPEGGEDLFFQTGEHFFAPKGYTGEWEIMAGEYYHYELSVITTPRAERVIKSEPLQPMRLDPNVLSGLSIDLNEDGIYQSTMIEGDELTISLVAERPQERLLTTPVQEHMICLLSGSLTITDLSGQTHEFFTGDFLIIPQGFTGDWASKGHGLTKWIQIEKSSSP